MTYTTPFLRWLRCGSLLLLALLLSAAAGLVRAADANPAAAAKAPAPADTRRAAEAGLERNLRAYLDRTFPCRVTKVAVDAQQIRVEGEAGAERGELVLVEVPISAQATEMASFPTAEPLRAGVDGRFALTLPRRPTPGGPDRLLSRWAIARRTGGACELLSHLRCCHGGRRLVARIACFPAGRSRAGRAALANCFPTSAMPTPCKRGPICRS